MQNYYKSYDKNIIGMHGGGKISKGDPIHIENRVQTITSKLKNDVNYMPPLFKIKDKGNKIEENTYENPDNYVIKNGNIQDYYYSAQQINNMNIINDNTSKLERYALNKENPIKSPPPLVTTYPEGELEITEEEEILKEKIREKIKEKVIERLKEELIKKEFIKNLQIENDIKKEISQKEKKKEFEQIKDNMGKNLWISENNIYTVKREKNNKLPWKNKECILNLNKKNRDNKLNLIENFTTNNQIDYSIIIFVALILIIIVTYTILRNRQ
jgi:hypothetical protein